MTRTVGITEEEGRGINRRSAAIMRLKEIGFLRRILPSSSSRPRAHLGSLFVIENWISARNCLPSVAIFPHFNVNCDLHGVRSYLVSF